MTSGANEDTFLFVDPNGADEVAESFLELGMGFGVGIAVVVGDDGGAAIEVDAAGVGEGAKFENAGGGEDGVAVGVGFFALRLALLPAGFRFGDFFVDAVAFFLDLFGGERFAVAGDGAVDTDAVDGDAFGVGGGGLFYVAIVLEFQLLEVDVVGVIASVYFCFLLVAFDVEQKLGDGWQRLGLGRRRGRGRCRLLRGDGRAGDAEEECAAALAHAEG